MPNWSRVAKGEVAACKLPGLWVAWRWRIKGQVFAFRPEGVVYEKHGVRVGKMVAGGGATRVHYYDDR